MNPQIKTAARRLPARTIAPPPTQPTGRCNACRHVNRWPTALPGINKRFFCMTCERNTIHQKIKA